MPKTNREVFNLDWIKRGFDPIGLRNHMLYLEKLVDRVSNLTKDSLNQMFEHDKDSILPQPHERDLYLEVVQHVTFCQQRYGLQLSWPTRDSDPSS